MRRAGKLGLPLCTCTFFLIVVTFSLNIVLGLEGGLIYQATDSFDR